MNTIAALIILNGYVLTAKRLVHERSAGQDPEAGATLEQLILIIGFVGLAIAAVAAITVAVNRRLSQIN